MGSFWGSKRNPNRFHRLSRSDPGRFGFRSGCLRPCEEGKANDGQPSDRSKRASGGVLGRLGGGLGPLLGVFGLSGWPPRAFRSAFLPCYSTLQNLVLLPNVFEGLTFSKSTTFCNGYETTHKSIKAKPNDSIHRFDLFNRFAHSAGPGMVRTDPLES